MNNFLNFRIYRRDTILRDIMKYLNNIFYYNGDLRVLSRTGTARLIEKEY